MSRKVIYCGHCNKDQWADIQVRIDSVFNYRDKEIKIDQEMYVCEVCGNKVYDEELDNKALKKVTETYKKNFASEIKELRKHFGLTQEIFAKMLNCGVATIKRYELGTSLPDSTQKGLLDMLKANPSYIEYFYQQNKDKFSKEDQETIESKINLQSINELKNLSYQVIRRLFEPYTGNISSGYTEFNPDKLLNMILYFSRNGILKTKLMKLLWYSDFLMFKRNIVSISGTPYWHRPFGPVPLSHDLLLGHLEDNLELINVNEEEKDNGYTLITIKANKNFDSNSFDQDELDVIKYVEDYFSNYGSVQISNFAHEELAWKETIDKQVISYTYAESLQLN